MGSNGWKFMHFWDHGSSWSQAFLQSIISERKERKSRFWLGFMLAFPKSRLRWYGMKDYYSRLHVWESCMYVYGVLMQCDNHLVASTLWICLSVLDISEIRSWLAYCRSTTIPVSVLVLSGIIVRSWESVGRSVRGHKQASTICCLKQWMPIKNVSQRCLIHSNRFKE